MTTDQEIRVLTLPQPWASAMGIKRIETHSGEITWDGYRGLVAIHAGKVNQAKSAKQTIELLEDEDGLPTELTTFAQGAHKLPTGAIVSVGRMVDSVIMTAPWIAQQSRVEQCLGDFDIARKGILFDDIYHLPLPIPYKGKQGLVRIKDKALATQLIAFWQSTPKF
ncbi:MAG: hypothetical protein RBJ76_13260 [Stenomitos frigidus ULC029]